MSTPPGRKWLLVAGVVVSATLLLPALTAVNAFASQAAAAPATVSSRPQASNGLTVFNPGMQHTEPDTAATLQIYYYEPDKSATVTFSATGLPPGLAINPGTGLISGTTGSTIASYMVTVTAADSDGSSDSVSFTWDVWNLITVSTPASEESYVGVPVDIAISATDSAGLTLTYGASDLPRGLAIDPATGVVFGTPATLGESNVTVTVTDGTGSAATADIGWAVGGHLTISNPGPRTTGAGKAADLTFKVTDSAAHDRVYYEAAGLPPGIELTSAPPVVSGFPTTAGIYHVNVYVADDWGAGAVASFTWTVRSASGTGPTGPVELGATTTRTLCLDDTGNSSANDASISIRACDGKVEQRWTYAEDGTLRIHGKCLYAPADPETLETATWLRPCTQAATEQWGLTSQVSLVSLASGYCLSDSDRWAEKRDAAAIVARCGFTGAPEPWPSQTWRLPPGPVLSGIPGKCLDVYRGQARPGARIDLAPCDGGKAQAWTFVPADQTVRIFGLCLTRTSANGTNESHVSLQRCTAADHARQWWGFAAGDGVSNNFNGHVFVLPPTGGGPVYDLAAPADFGASPALVVLTSGYGPSVTWHVW